MKPTKQRLEEAEEALREIYMLCGNGDPSDGEGTSPQEVVEAVRAIRDLKDIQLALWQATFQKYQSWKANGCTRAKLDDIVADFEKCSRHQSKVDRFVNVKEFFMEEWPLADVLTKLCEATDHLLRGHDCDTHGHEAYQMACAVGKRYAARLIERGSK